MLGDGSANKHWCNRTTRRVTWTAEMKGAQQKYIEDPPEARKHNEGQNTRRKGMRWDAIGLTSRGWGSPCRRCSAGLRQPSTARSRPSRSTCGPAKTRDQHPAHTRDMWRAHLLHLHQHVLVRRQLAILGEQLLFLLGKALQTPSSVYDYDVRMAARTMVSIFFSLAGCMLLVPLD